MGGAPPPHRTLLHPGRACQCLWHPPGHHALSRSPYFSVHLTASSLFLARRKRQRHGRSHRLFQRIPARPTRSLSFSLTLSRLPLRRSPQVSRFQNQTRKQPLIVPTSTTPPPHLPLHHHPLSTTPTFHHARQPSAAIYPSSAPHRPIAPLTRHQLSPKKPQVYSPHDPHARPPAPAAPHHAP